MEIMVNAQENLKLHLYLNLGCSHSTQHPYPILYSLLPCPGKGGTGPAKRKTQPL